MQESNYFLNLHSGKRVTRDNLTVYPMPAKFILVVHHLMFASKNHRSIAFTGKDANGNQRRKRQLRTQFRNQE